MKTIYIALLCAALTAAGCHPYRNCAAPDLDLPAAFAPGEADDMSLADLDWWEVYSDSTLRVILEQTLGHNRDLAAAAARIEQLRQLYGIDRVNFLPSLGANAYIDHETNHYSTGKRLSDSETGIKATIAWEADLWGGLAAARARGYEQFRASAEQERALRVSLIAEAAAAYFRLVALDCELEIARRTLFTREEYLDKARLRFEGGLTPQTVYRQAQVEYATTAALIPGIERQIQVQENALALLMGRYPERPIARGVLDIDTILPDSLPLGVPSGLLTRRPDLRAAEANLKAALAGVGVAYADRFPRLKISLTGGVENDELAGVLRSPFSYVIGSVAGPLVDFGRNRRRHLAAVAAYDQARLAYEQKVLAAFGEVSTAAGTMNYTRQTALRKRELRDAARAYASLAYTQYNAGWIAYIDVLDAQRRYFDAEIGLARAVCDQYLALTYLYRVLGGGVPAQE